MLLYSYVLALQNYRSDLDVCWGKKPKKQLFCSLLHKYRDPQKNGKASASSCILGI